MDMKVVTSRVITEYHGTFGFRAPYEPSKGPADTSEEDGQPKDRHLLQERRPNDLLAEVMATCRVRDESGRVQQDECRVTGCGGLLS